jgi:hypothetical protein
MQLSSGDIAIIVTLALGAIIAGLYFLNRWAMKKTDENQRMIEQSKMSVSMYVIDKKRDYVKNVNMPKAVYEQMPKFYRFIKMNFVKAKVGPQILTFFIDKHLFKFVEPKKTIRADVAGIYIVSIKGVKTSAEMKKLASDKKKADKQARENEKLVAKAAKRK